MNGSLWVELGGDIIIARLRGEPTIELRELIESPMTAKLVSVK